jgi:uncharacterized protein with von Willebrand factor type A (vWA) domain
MQLDLENKLKEEQLTEEEIERLRNQLAGMQDEIDGLAEEGALSAEQLESLDQALQAQMGDIEDAARQAVRPAIKAAAQEIGSILNAEKSFQGGGFDPGKVASNQAPERRSPAERLALGRKMKNSWKLQKIAEVTGRFVNIAMAKQMQKTNMPPTEIIGVQTGDDLAHLVGSELALLASEETEDLFFAKFAEKKLLTYELEGREKQGKGPIWVALDSSGSMNGGGANGLSAEIWAKGCALALVAIARLQKRDIAICHFSSMNQVRTDVFEKGNASPEKLMDTVEHFFGSGTYYEGWMKACMKMVEQAKFDKADVILISDGDVFLEDAVVEDWKRLRDRRGMACHSVLIGVPGYSQAYCKEQLDRISDETVDLLDLTADAKALDTLFSI